MRFGYISAFIGVKVLGLTVLNNNNKIQFL